MISKFITPGNRVEIQMIDKEQDENLVSTYFTKIHDVVSDDQLELVMPMEKTKLILLPVDCEYNLIFYGQTGPFQCSARVIDRYKSNNVYILVVELTSNLRKYQRREYYRFSCALEMCSRSLEKEEIDAIESKNPYKLTPGLPLKRSVIVDISGGGLRFLSTQIYSPGSLLYCSYHLLVGGIRKQYEMIGKVLLCKEIENRPGTYEHRVQYVDMNEDEREEIIKYIFEEERKSRKKERFGL